MDAAMDAPATIQNTDNPRPALNRPGPSWTAVAAMMLSVMMPVCGWLVTLSNRVAALETKTDSLATSAQMAEVKQKIDDWIAESDRLRVDDRVAAAREAR
jgi:hypothetical protein